MRPKIQIRAIAALLVTLSMLLLPMSALAKKGEKNFKAGLQYEAAQQWDKAAQEFALAIAANPADTEYQLHYRRAFFNASQMYMIQGQALGKQEDYVGAYNAFRQAYGYDPVNQLALSEMDRMLRLQKEKEAAREGASEGKETARGVKMTPTSYDQSRGSGNSQPGSSGESGSPRSARQDQSATPTGTEQLRVINYSGDLKAFIRSLAEQLNLNVVFDTLTFRQPRNVDINLRNVTTAQALDYLFLQEQLFFQKLNRRTILVAEQTRRPQYQQLVLRTFYLANADPQDALRLIQQAIPAQSGRPPTIAIPDKATNSLTVRDTAENVTLIGELISSIDKDRAEVVMDVSIYEVSRSDLMQFGNQIGSDSSLANLGGTSGGIFTLFGNRTAITNGLSVLPATALGGALLIPASGISALQTKSNTKLLASTQIHAFSGEESSARIGQRVPVQTAQTFPFSTTTSGSTGGSAGNVFGGNGFPVINYEPTGLTLKFTPQVFPNLDVQVKMSIESKDVFNSSLTPTFIERTITGTARIQNNRTMMLVSLAQDKASDGRKGLPLVGLIPILGRLFSTPTRDNAKTDIVIAVTPRVLRAPAVTPEDERARPSGTLQTPTQGSLEAMMIDAEREDQQDQLAAARRTPASTVAKVSETRAQDSTTTTNLNVKNEVVAKEVINKDLVTVESDAGSPSYVPAPIELMSKDVTRGGALQSGNTSNSTVAQGVTTSLVRNNVAVGAPPTVSNPGVSIITNEAPARALAATIPLAGDSMVALLKLAASQPVLKFDQAVEGDMRMPTVAVGEPPRLLSTERVMKALVGSTAELRLIPERSEMLVGEKRRLAIVLKTDAPLGLAVLTLRFDPSTVVVRNVSTGNLFAGQFNSPGITQSVNAGVLLVSVAPPSGIFLTGAGVLAYVDIEAVGVGKSSISFDKANMHLVASDGRDITMLLVQGDVVVKQK